ncbi:AsmA-like C-terminal region [Palleronia marisminoris]|uniref:YhdP central domain-containing protein n=1 Tax=Palleronia marisminoris TaxID=315423 RepID=A0A1Y5RHC4_9RHOB|nr:hypothetical protein [Palleronia marisminoris]SFG21012.1 AsmA-like C-terminal region [Palleronia marisminoris]SLN17374.1 hypothetical protein PAM7066_00518 [Palleronia marisminoris]
MIKRIHTAGRAGAHVIRTGVLLAVGFAVAIVAVAAMLVASGERIALPAVVVAAIESRIDARAAGVDVDLGTVSVGLDRPLVPRLRLEDVRVSAPDGGEIARVSEVGLAFDTAAALSGRVAPSILRVNGARLVLRRDAEGRFALSFGSGGEFIADSPGALLDLVEGALDRPPLDRVERVELTGAEITLEDARANRVWQVTDGSAALTRGAEGLTFDLDAEIFNGTEDLARARIALSTRSGDSGARLEAEFDRVAAADIAAQSPALAVLSVLDAPISGQLATTLGAEGALQELSATLEIGAGSLDPRRGTPPLDFQHARAALTFDPATRRIALREVSIDAADGSGRLSGQAYLDEIGPDGFPNALIAQLNVEELRLDTPALFPEPVSALGGTLDMRIRLDPFTVDVGAYSLSLDTEGTRDALTGDARAWAGEDGWSVDLSLTAERMTAERLRRYWPKPVARKARQFFLDRVGAGTAVDPVVVLRQRPEAEKPEANVSFAFEDATTLAVPFLPPVTDASGFATLDDFRFALRVASGRMTPEDRAPVDLTGTTFVIPDIRERPSQGQIEIVSDGPLPSVLALIDSEPLSFLSKAGRTPDLAQGHLSATTTITLPLKKGVKPEEISFTSDGTLTDLQSDTLVAGRTITADRMEVSVDRDRIRVEGRAQFDGVPFDGAWQQALSGEDRGRGTVSGRATVSAESLATLGVALPDGLLSGSGTAEIEIALAPDTAPRLTARSDLSGLALAVSAVNWSKPPDRTGTFELQATLGATPVVDRLQLEAPGLSARGRVDLQDGTRFRALTLDRVVLGDWFEGAVTIAAQGNGRPVAITVPSGSVDLRRAQLGGGSGSGSGSGGGGSGTARGPVSLRLDEVTLTDTIALRDAAIDLAPGVALSGEFRGRVNGGTEVTGALVGEARGTAIRVQTQDAGALLRDAGLVDRVQGGQLDLILRPTGDAGTYEGQARVTNPLLRDAPAIAELLSAISVVGLLEQLETRGIPFEDVSAEFRVSPQQITLYRSSATGASLGLSMDGVYDTVNKRLDMQGVVSPIYLLNRIGSIFTRQGEGLFGVNFTLQGPVSQPQVGVNPLSILTPGMFREIFRRPPPARPAE